MSESIKSAGCEGNLGFYREIFFKGFSAVFIVWSFMIVSFWWGNHDWGYLKGGVVLADGFFEARYSQHLFTVLLFDGHILPVMTICLALAALVFKAMLTAEYLEIEKTKGKWLFFVLILALNPYCFVLFYYVYLSFSFVIWSIGGIIGLFLLRRPHKLYKIFLATCLFILVLGSYPANIAYIWCLFLSGCCCVMMPTRRAFLRL